jgi:hypothetical protein
MRSLDGSDFCEPVPLPFGVMPRPDRQVRARSFARRMEPKLSTRARRALEGLATLITLHDAYCLRSGCDNTRIRLIIKTYGDGFQDTDSRMQGTCAVVEIAPMRLCQTNGPLNVLSGPKNQLPEPKLAFRRRKKAAMSLSAMRHKTLSSGNGAMNSALNAW